MKYEARLECFYVFLSRKQKVESGGKYSLIRLCRIWCEECQRLVDKIDDPTAITSILYYNCNLCNAQIDICTPCYIRGARCSNAKHLLGKVSLTYISLPWTTDITNIIKQYAVEDEFESFARDAELGCERSVFFRTSSGMIGSAYEAVVRGDVVAVFFGCRVPMVLREHGSGYRLVSDYYVDDLMDGEAIDMWKRGEVTLRTFDIL